MGKNSVIYIILFVVAFGFGMWFMRQISPPKKVPGLTPDQVDSLRNVQMRVEGVIDSLESVSSAEKQKRNQILQQLKIERKLYEEKLKNIPQHPISPDLSEYTFEDKVDLFNNLTKQVK